MPIDNRELVAGTTLVASYKKTQFSCEVIDSDAGRAFKLADGRTFKSPSSAGKAITGRVSCDGWQFWSLGAGTAATDPTAGEPPSAATSSKPAKPKATKRLRQIKKLPNQKGVEEGQTRWFCSGCMKGFNMPTGQEPAACPEGHAWEVTDEFEPAS